MAKQKKMSPLERYAKGQTGRLKPEPTIYPARKVKSGPVVPPKGTYVPPKRKPGESARPKNSRKPKVQRGY